MLKWFLREELIATFREEVDAEGHLLTAVEESQALDAAKRLLDAGAQIIVVSFANAHLNPANEQKFKSAMNQRYPDHYLGSVPILLASQLNQSPDLATRTTLAVLNAYTQKDLTKFLYKGEDQCRNNGYKHPLLVVHANGGVTRVAKTKAIDTLGSGPAAGYLGSVFWAKQYALTNVLSLDIGGTSLDFSAVVNGEAQLTDRGEMFDLAVEVPFYQVYSLAGGGGSVVKVINGKVEVGPESAGARPGPVCYDLGGMDPTITDANLLLGLLDPGFYLGGRRVLNKEKAGRIVQERLADPLKMTIAEAAWAAFERLNQLGVSEIEKELPAAEEGKFTTLFAFGGPERNTILRRTNRGFGSSNATARIAAL